MKIKAERMQHDNNDRNKHKVWRTYFYESIELKRSIKVFHRRSLMFSVRWYLSISLSIESLSTIKSPAAAGGGGGERECTDKKREAQRVRQQRQWSKLTGKLTAVKMEMVMQWCHSENIMTWTHTDIAWYWLLRQIHYNNLTMTK